MQKKWIFVALVFGLIIFGFDLRSFAGCKSDCRQEYDSEIESCNEQYDDPSEASKLQACIDDAKREYQSCMDECEN